MDLLKKTVIVTGANRGTGRVIAENFIAHGAEVFIHSLIEGDSQKAVRTLWRLSAHPQQNPGRLSGGICISKTQGIDTPLEQKVKLVRPKWYENKWLYFTYGVLMTATSVRLAGQIVD